MSFLRVSNLSAQQGDSAVLENLSFSLDAGARLALVGSNGAGKTSFFRCLLGRLAYSGAIEIDSKQLAHIPSKERAQRFAYVPQRLDTHYAFSVDEFLRLSQYARRKVHSASSELSTLRELRQAALERCGVHDFASRALTTLSMGERQRVMLAAALAQDADVLLLDEPTAFLDPRGIEQFFEVLTNLPKEQHFILASHELNYVTRLCTEVLALKEGRKIFQGASAAFMQQEVLSEVFGIKAQFVTKADSSIPILLPPQYTDQ